MNKTLEKILNLRLTPVICIIILMIENQYTYAIYGGWPYRVFEIVLCLIALAAALRMGASWKRTTLIVFSAFLLLTCGIELSRNLEESRLRPEQFYSTRTDVQTPSTSHYYGSGYGYIGYTGNTYTNAGIYKSTCYLCDGAGSVVCRVCKGSGKNDIYDDLGPVLKGIEKPYCEACGGKGKIVCGACHGSGYD